MGHAILERVRLFGTRSADYITASGHSGCIATEASLQAKTGRIHDRTRTLRCLPPPRTAFQNRFTSPRLM